MMRPRTAETGRPASVSTTSSVQRTEAIENTADVALAIRHTSEAAHQSREIATLTRSNVIGFGGSEGDASDRTRRQLQSCKGRQIISPGAVPTQCVGCGGKRQLRISKSRLSLMQGRQQVGQDHEPIEVAEHRRHQVAPDSIHIRVEAGLHQLRERASARQWEELHPGWRRAWRRHQEASRLQESQSNLITHPLQDLGVKPVSGQASASSAPTPAGRPRTKPRNARANSAVFKVSSRRKVASDQSAKS